MGAMRKFHGTNAYFEGWYFKQQCELGAAAFIPSFHADGIGHRCASLQIITDREALSYEFPAEELGADRKQLVVRLGNCVFSETGCRLNLKKPGASVSGELHYAPLCPLSGDIMGPFRWVPFMECRHRVFSVSHRVDGELTINGKATVFHDGRGYIEGDRGSSFPIRYVWTQCNSGDDCVMLSIADIPFCGTTFQGCIGFVYVAGKEYRLATYLGLKILHITDDTVAVRQGGLLLQVRLVEEGHSELLSAPKSGWMTRRIRESLACRVNYTCLLNGKILLDLESSQASYENNWEEKP